MSQQAFQIANAYDKGEPRMLRFVGTTIYDVLIAQDDLRLVFLLQISPVMPFSVPPHAQFILNRPAQLHHRHARFIAGLPACEAGSPMILLRTGSVAIEFRCDGNRWDAKLSEWAGNLGNVG